MEEAAKLWSLQVSSRCPRIHMDKHSFTHSNRKYVTCGHGEMGISLHWNYGVSVAGRLGRLSRAPSPCLQLTLG